MDTGYSHEVDICVELGDCFDRGCSDGDDGVPEEAATDEDHLDVDVVDELEGDGRTVGDDGCFEVQRDVSCDLSCGCASVEDYNLSWPDHLCSCAADGYFAFRGDSFAFGEICSGGGGR